MCGNFYKIYFVVKIYTFDLSSSKEEFYATLGVVTSMLMKMAVFRVVALCR